MGFQVVCRRAGRFSFFGSGNWAAAMVMTQQYLAGELSVLLAQLRELATAPVRACQVERLRQEAETVPLAVLGCVTARALSVTNALCWDSIARGDMEAFRRQAELSAQLHEFGVCAGLLTER